jgi:outer membrane protein OmpA-like peptidoglycan-associated protein
MRRLAVALSLLTSLGACATPGGTAAPQKFVVYFQEWSANLDDAAKTTITQAAGYATQHPTQSVTVAGFAAPDGSVQANVDLSRTRAQVVVDQLKQDGVDGGRIHLAARGPTEIALSSIEGRRVEIDVGAP